MKHHFDDEVAARHGVASAILIDNIAYFINRNIKAGAEPIDGHIWMAKTVSSFTKKFKYYTDDQVRRILKKAIKSGAIISSKNSKHKSDQTKSYALSCPIVKRVYLAKSPNDQSAKTSNDQSAKVPNDQSAKVPNGYATSTYSTTHSNSFSIGEKINENPSFKNSLEKILPDADFQKVKNLFVAARASDRINWKRKSEEELLGRWDKYLYTCKLNGYETLKKSVKIADEDRLRMFEDYDSELLKVYLISELKGVSEDLGVSFRGGLGAIAELIRDSFNVLRLADVKMAISSALDNRLSVAISARKSLSGPELRDLLKSYLSVHKGYFAQLMTDKDGILKLNQ